MKSDKFSILTSLESRQISLKKPTQTRRISVFFPETHNTRDPSTVFSTLPAMECSLPDTWLMRPHRFEGPIHWSTPLAEREVRIPARAPPFGMLRQIYKCNKLPRYFVTWVHGHIVSRDKNVYVGFFTEEFSEFTHFSRCVFRILTYHINKILIFIVFIIISIVLYKKTILMWLSNFLKSMMHIYSYKHSSPHALFNNQLNHYFPRWVSIDIYTYRNRQVYFRIFANTFDVYRMESKLSCGSYRIWKLGIDDSRFAPPGCRFGVVSVWWGCQRGFMVP